MPNDMTTTCWRGLSIEHPTEWEMSFASSFDAPKRCSFSDRRSERLDVRWRPLKAVPNLDHMIERYRDKAPKNRDDVRLEVIEDLPAPWSGLLQKGPDGKVLYAGRFFAEQRILVEVTLAWPKRRHTSLEARCLGGIAPLPTDVDATRWRAMGMDVSVPAEFDLVEHSSKVGRQHWVFEDPARNGATLMFDRYAMVETWLKTPIQSWLETQLPHGRVIRRTGQRIHGHMAERLLSRRRHGTLSSLRGVAILRVDLAWTCPMDTRLYHIIFERPARGEDLDLPACFDVKCCQLVPVPQGERS